VTHPDGEVVWSGMFLNTLTNPYWVIHIIPSEVIMVIIPSEDWAFTKTGMLSED